jgi:hypothetical protein
MSSILATIIRHPDENLSKCTLEPLRLRKELSFFQFNTSLEIDASNAIVLSVEAPVISKEDVGRPLILLDGNWKHVPKLKSCLKGHRFTVLCHQCRRLILEETTKGWTH